jgi:hypothetical protein
MKNITKIAAVSLLALMVFPTAAFAHGNKDNDSHDDNGKHRGIIKRLFHGREDKDHKMLRSGTVTAVGSSSFDMKLKDGTVVTVLTASAKITKPFESEIKLADIKVDDKASVVGTLNGSQITATHVMITPMNTHPAKAKGTVTAVNGNTVTVQTQHQGVVSNVTVNTNANTQVTKADGSTGTAADVQVGSTVKVKGLWNEILNVLNAIKIRIK